MGRRRDRQPRLLRSPGHGPDLRPRLPRGESRRRYRLRVPQSENQVQLMAAPTISVTAPGATRASHGLWRDALRRLIRNKPGVLGMVCIAIFVTAAILAPVIAPYGPLAGTLADR